MELASATQRHLTASETAKENSIAKLEQEDFSITPPTHLCRSTSPRRHFDLHLQPPTYTSTLSSKHPVLFCTPLDGRHKNLTFHPQTEENRREVRESNNEGLLINLRIRLLLGRSLDGKLAQILSVEQGEHACHCGGYAESESGSEDGCGMFESYLLPYFPIFPRKIYHHPITPTGSLTLSPLCDC